MAAESPAVESSARENGAKPTSDPSRQAEAAPVPAEADEDFLRDKRAEGGTPESGEISGKEPTEATAVGGADPEVANSSRKRGAERYSLAILCKVACSPYNQLSAFVPILAIDGAYELYYTYRDQRPFKVGFLEPFSLSLDNVLKKLFNVVSGTRQSLKPQRD